LGRGGNKIAAEPGMIGSFVVWTVESLEDKAVKGVCKIKPVEYQEEVMEAQYQCWKFVEDDI
jgi:hypothetical protein